MSVVHFNKEYVDIKMVFSQNKFLISRKKDKILLKNFNKKKHTVICL